MPHAGTQCCTCCSFPAALSTAIAGLRGAGSHMHSHKNEQFNYVAKGTLKGSRAPPRDNRCVSLPALVSA